jgi:lysozyme
MAETARSNKAALVALVGAPAAAIALMLTQHWEGTKYIGYADVIGKATYCTGVTGPGAVIGKHYTRVECDDADSKALLAHAIPVMKCTPGLRDKPHALGAAISFTYNVGTGIPGKPKAGGYCGSTAARLFNAGNIAGGCRSMAAWNKAHGKFIQGLANRRLDPKLGEVTECLKDAR